MSSLPEAPTATCPRCGYDQRGVITTWHETCPLDGTCAECGFQFKWRELLDERLVLPPWSVEARRSSRTWPRQFLATTARCWLSPLIWRRLQAFHPINHRRLACWLVTWIALILAMSMVSNGLMAIGEYQSRSGAVAVIPGTVSATTSTASGSLVFLHATLLPWSSKSIGRMTAPAFGLIGQPHSPPSALFHYQWRRIGVPIIALIAMPLACSLTFAALPVSRRRAKVRWRHIVRAGLYFCGICCAVACGLVISQGLNTWQVMTGAVQPNLTSRDILIDMLRTISTVAALLATLMFWAFVPATLAFWWAAAKHYLRMQHAIAIGLSVSIVGLLSPIAVIGLLWFVFDFRLQL